MMTFSDSILVNVHVLDLIFIKFLFIKFVIFIKFSICCC